MVFASVAQSVLDGSAGGVGGEITDLCSGSMRHMLL